MSDAVLVGIIGAASTALVALWSWLRGRTKDKVETEAAQQAALATRFQDADSLTKYVQEQVKEAVEVAVAPLREEIKRLKLRQGRVYDAFRRFYTQLWAWDRSGRLGPLPTLTPQLMEELRLAHLLELPFEDTEPILPKPDTTE